MIRASKEAKGKVGEANGVAAGLGLKRTTSPSRMRKNNIARLYQ